MDSTSLVEPAIEDGRALLAALDAKGVKITAAYWFFLSEPNEWRLILATPLVDSKGPRDAYQQIQQILQSQLPNGKLSLDLISVVSPNNPQVRALSSALTTGPGITGIRFSRNTVNGIFIEDAYIYRLS